MGDKRITFEDWPKLKPDVPFNGLPMLEVDGKKLGQSGSILRYLGKEFGLAGSNSYEAAVIDSIADTVTDIREKPIPFIFEKDEEKKKEGLHKFFSETLPDLLGKLDAIAAGNGYFVGSKTSYADTHFFAVMDFLCSDAVPEEGRPSLDKYPKLKSIHDKVASLSGVSSYL